MVIKGQMGKIIFQFYRQFWVFTQSVGWASWWAAGMPLGEEIWLLIGGVFWLKIFSYLFVWYVMYFLKANSFTYYQNLNYSVRQLFLLSFTADMFVFFAALALINFLFSCF